MKYSIVLGTRPEIIKMSPVIRKFKERHINYFILHTGQHYSYEMDKIFFDEIGLDTPRYNLNIGSSSHGKQTGEMLLEIEKIFLREKPDVVLVQGDTNTVLAGALAASKLHIKVAHIEGGLRSYDKSMPEEINRVLTDHCSDYLFPPTEKSKNILCEEGIPQEKIFVTGNTIVDAVKQNLKIADKKVDILKKLNLTTKKYFLVTTHREENVDDKDKLKNIIFGLKEISKKYSLPIIFPVHPRTRKKIAEFKIDVSDIEFIDPIGFLEFLQLEANAKLVLTDSGGVQEETCILKVPCVTLRENTERPETIEVGSNILVGTDKKRMINGVKEMLGRKIEWKNPFGDGTSAEKIIDILTRRI